MFVKDRLNLNSEREYSAEGFLRVPARISRTGIQEYRAIELNITDRDPNDIIKVYRPEDEVFKDASLKSFASKPVTNNHPPELVNSKNASKYIVGMSETEVSRDGDFVTTVLNITSEDAIRAIESGKVELSNGYEADIELTPGITPTGEHYDAIQRNINGNHIAIVTKGRAGSSCKVADNQPKNESVNMATITIDGVDFEVTDQVAQAVLKQQAKLSDAEKEIEKKDKDLKAKDEEMEAKEKDSKKKADAMQAKVDDAQSKIISDEALDKLVDDRADFVAKVKQLDSDIETNGKSNAVLMSEVVAAKCPNVQLDSVSSDYIQARFDMLVESFQDNSQQTLDAAFTKQVTKDTEVVDSRPAHVIARENMIARNRNLWKKGESN